MNEISFDLFLRTEVEITFALCQARSALAQLLPYGVGMGMPNTFGSQLAELLGSRGLSHRRFGELVGSGQGYISQVIRGVRTPPLARLPRWMEALGLDSAAQDALVELALLAHCPDRIVDRMHELSKQAVADKARIAELEQLVSMLQKRLPTDGAQAKEDESVGGQPS